MKVKFVPQNIELEIASGQSVKDLADKNGIFIKSVCNGIPNCSECRVRVIEGEQNVLPPGTKELNLIGTGYFIDQRRLSCQLICFGDITVEMSEQIEKQNSQQARKPQGSRKSEEEVTHAVSGNLLIQDEGIKELYNTTTQTPTRQNNQRPRQNNLQQDNQNKNNQNRSGQHQGNQNQQRPNQNNQNQQRQRPNNNQNNKNASQSQSQNRNSRPKK